MYWLLVNANSALHLALVSVILRDLNDLRVWGCRSARLVRDAQNFKSGKARSAARPHDSPELSCPDVKLFCKLEPRIEQHTRGLRCEAWGRRSEV